MCPEPIYIYKAFYLKKKINCDWSVVALFLREKEIGTYNFNMEKQNCKNGLAVISHKTIVVKGYTFTNDGSCTRFHLLFIYRFGFIVRFFLFLLTKEKQ